MSRTSQRNLSKERKVTTKQTVIKPEDLIQNILQLMHQQIKKLSEQKEDLSDAQVRLLPEILRVLLAANKKEKEEEEDLKVNLANLSTDKLQEMLKK